MKKELLENKNIWAKKWSRFTVEQNSHSKFPCKLQNVERHAR